MSKSVGVVWDEGLTAYDFGADHPLAPIRLELTMDLARQLGVLDLGSVEVVDAQLADDDVLTLVHDPDYVAAVRAAGSASPRVDYRRGLGIPDNPVFPKMHEASALVVGCSVTAASLVWRGDKEHAVNLAGGLHHAMAGAASGFCIYNDPAVAIAWLLANGADRVAYVDIDVHHGDGVQDIFYADPRVLTISMHESGRYLFPGTGFADEVGGPGAEGTSVNVALPPGTGDADWRRAFDAVVPPLLRAFGPDVLVSQHGCDTHTLDPLAHLALTVDGQRASYAALHELAHYVCGGRWLAVGGGGYEIVHVVPRAWTHLLAEVAGEPLDPNTATPTPWQATAGRVQARTAALAPEQMTDVGAPFVADVPAAARADLAEAVSQAVEETRRAVFGHHGLGT
jgi:acetoin utilization protein AcuC